MPKPARITPGMDSDLVPRAARVRQIAGPWRSESGLAKSKTRNSPRQNVLPVFVPTKLKMPQNSQHFLSF